MKKVVTVLGEILPEELGITMSHEHIVCDISRESGKADNILNDARSCSREVAAFKAAGGATMVDVTTEDIGRDPTALKEISKTTGVNIITTTGYYSGVLFPEYVLRMSIDELAGHMTSEVQNGICDTGIRPGIIGELASKQSRIMPLEEKVLRAAARTHNETGLSISLHSGHGRPGPGQLAVLKEESVSPDRVIAGHADLVWHERIEEDLEYFQLLLDQGCYLGFDTIGWDEYSPESERIKRIAVLAGKGYAGQILLSSDLCRRSFYHENGGRGYDHVLRTFVPKLREQGISSGDIDLMLTDNPKQALSF